MKPFTVIATAILEPGAITQRVSRVRRPTAAARKMMLECKRIHAQDRIPAQRKNHERDQRRGFATIGVAIYPATLQALDDAVLYLKKHGRADMSRSKLIRIAVRRLNVAEIALEDPE